MTERPPPLDLKWDSDLTRRLAQALEEDVGGGDVTTEAIVPARMKAVGKLTAREAGIFCGAPVAERVWRMVGRTVSIDWKVGEGRPVRPGQSLARLAGPYRALLVGERLALNFLQRLSGIATLTDQLRRAAGGDRGPQICDTRKTTPLWRRLERYAVRAGGGVNHRFGLFDMVLIKENHVRSAGGLAEAIERAKAGAKARPIAAEVQNADQVRQACRLGVDLILLDNMTPAQARGVIQRFRTAAVAFEVSGGVNMKNIKAYARTGADRISIGAITHSAPALDLSLQLYPVRKDAPSHAHLSRRAHR